MTLWTFVRRSLRHHRRANIGIGLGAAVGAAVLAGALMIGDSVRGSLRRIAALRLGDVALAVAPGDRFFRADPLAEGLAADLGARAAPAISLRGTASSEDGSVRANPVQILGIDGRFAALAPAGPDREFPLPAAGEVVLNERLAARLRAAPGSSIVLRMERPSALPRDVALAGDEDASVGVRLAVRAIAADEAFGRFSLQANQVPPATAFLSLAWLAERIGQAGRANLLLVGSKPGGLSPSPDEARAALRARFDLEDAQLALRRAPDGGLELASERIFLDPEIEAAGIRAAPGARGILTYFVDEIRREARATPYSMVTAMDRPGLAGDEIAISDWLADDLGAAVGDAISLSYVVLADGGRLETRRASFRVASIWPLDGPDRDPTLMPPFPGLAGEENCRDWRPGIPIELDRIREKDEAYWDAHRGTPKAFISLAAGKKLWSNRFGALTAIRYPAPADEAALRTAIREGIDPASLGFAFQPVRELARRASGEALDFAQLFLGLSSFLLASALLLTGLLFALSVEGRASEVGTLLALGFRPRRVRLLLLVEGLAIAGLGSVVGVVAAIGYTRGMLAALETVWSGAVGGMSLIFDARPISIAIGLLAGIAMAGLAMGIVIRGQARRPIREVLSGAARIPRLGFARSPISIVAGAAAAIAALSIIAGAAQRGESAAAGAFFGAGALLLVAGLAFSHALLGGRAGRAERLTLRGLGLRNATRRRGRSMATVASLACGTFLVIAVGANRRDPLAGAGERVSGTGGFAWIGESAIPIHRDPNDPEVRRRRGIEALDPERVRIVAMRVREGDDASCLNMNRPQRPRIIGVRTAELAERGAFRFARIIEGRGSGRPWDLLGETLEGGAIPAIADHATIVWSLGSEVGGTIRLADERGEEIAVRFVASLAPSILQGGILIGEDAFIRLFPSSGGARLFLVDAPRGEEAEAAEALARAYGREGLALVPAAERLAEYYALENTYLAIFQLLGGLGILVGSIGLGLVVLRNLLERRGELALLRAVGFAPRRLRRLILWEHGGLLGLGLACGAAAAAVAVLPAVRAAGAAVPVFSLGLTLAGILANGFAWTWLAAALALRGRLLDALREE